MIIALWLTLLIVEGLFAGLVVGFWRIFLGYA